MADTLSMFTDGSDPAPPSFKLDRAPEDLTYFDFPSNREAFAHGQKDARPHIEGGCYWRLRGRTVLSYTLLTFQDPAEAWDQIKAKKKAGFKVQVLNWAGTPPVGIPTKKSHTEYWVENWSTMRRKKTRGPLCTKLAPAWIRGLTIRPPTEAEASQVFKEWVEWPGDRHFMVMKGHYLEWLRRHFAGESTGTSVLGYFHGDRPLGIFGGETYRGVGVIVVAKHLPDVKADVLWVRGLESMGDGRILCGSTADMFKTRMGMNSMSSWTFDLSSLKQEESPDV